MFLIIYGAQINIFNEVISNINIIIQIQYERIYNRELIQRIIIGSNNKEYLQ